MTTQSQTEALKLALKELETWQRFTHGENEHTNKAITAIKEALAQPERIYTKNDLRAEYKRGLRDGGDKQYAPNW